MDCLFFTTTHMGWQSVWWKFWLCREPFWVTIRTLSHLNKKLNNLCARSCPTLHLQVHSTHKVESVTCESHGKSIQNLSVKFTSPSVKKAKSNLYPKLCLLTNLVLVDYRTIVNKKFPDIDKSQNHLKHLILIPKTIWIAGGLMYKLPASNLQYVTAITFLLATYSKYMAATKHNFNCGNLLVTPGTLRSVAKKQVLLITLCWMIIPSCFLLSLFLD